MNRDVRDLLGGYATGTLTEAEQKRLFEAALHDQELFAALADEQALCELLADPAAKEQLLRTVTRRKDPRMWSAPVAIAAMLVIAVGAGMLWLRLNPPAQEIAMSLPAPAVSEPARPEAERKQPPHFKPEEPLPQQLRTPSIAPPPAAIAVSKPAPKIKLAQPPAAVAPPAAFGAGAAAQRAEAENVPAGLLAHRIVRGNEGTRVYLTPLEPGSLTVVARGPSGSELVLSIQATPGTEVGTAPLGQDVTEVVATLDPKARLLNRLAPTAPRTARQSAAAETAPADAAASTYTVRIPIPKI